MNQSVGSRRMHEEDATSDALFNGSATPALQESWHLRQSWSLNQCYRGTNSGSVSDNKKVDSRLVVLLSKLLLGNLRYTRRVKSKGSHQASFCSSPVARLSISAIIVTFPRALPISTAIAFYLRFERQKGSNLGRSTIWPKMDQTAKS